MNWTTIIIETIIMTIAFTAMILIPLVKNPVWWIHDYPEDIQEEYFKTHERVPSEFFSKTVLIKKGLALVLALLLILGLMKLAGAYDFWSALALSYGIWLFTPSSVSYYPPSAHLNDYSSTPAAEWRYSRKPPRDSCHYHYKPHYTGSYSRSVKDLSAC